MGTTHHQAVTASGTVTAAAFVGPITGAVTGTATGAVAASTLSASGNTTLSGNVTATGTSKKVTVNQVVIPSAANAVCGVRTIATAGTGKYSIATTAVRTSSRIFLTPKSSLSGAAPKHAMVGTVGTGVSFSIRLLTAAATGATGPVSWHIINIT